MKHFIKTWIFGLLLLGLFWSFNASIWRMPIQWARENKDKVWQCGDALLAYGAADSVEISLANYDLQRVRIVLACPYLDVALATPVAICSVQVKDTDRAVIDGMVFSICGYSNVISHTFELPPTANIFRVKNIHASEDIGLMWNALLTPEGDQ